MEQQQQNNIVALRSTLFDTLRGLSDKDKPMDVERAKAICDTSQAIINSVKVEIDFAKVTGLQLSSNFIPSEAVVKPKKLGAIPIPPDAKKEGHAPALPTPYGTSNPVPGVTVHRSR